LPEIIKKYLKWEITLTVMPRIDNDFTRRISKSQGLIDPNESAGSAYNKIRAFSRWPKAYLTIDDKRYIVHEAALKSGKLQILKIQPEGKKTISFDEFKNGYRLLLTKMPKFVNID
jgi:methionyl-tRNA formyltransferase